MTEPYLGQIMVFGGNFAPSGFSLCNGQTLQISQNAALHAVVGVYFGGNGTSTFQLPNLQGTAVLGYGGDYPIAVSGGAESVALAVNELPMHSHTVTATSQPAAGRSPAGGIFAASLTSSEPLYGAASPQINLAAGANATGGGGAHTNMQPYLPLSFCITLRASSRRRTDPYTGAPDG